MLRSADPHCGLGIAVIFPDDDDDKAKENGIKHANHRELEPSDLVVEAQAARAPRAAANKH